MSWDSPIFAVCLVPLPHGYSVNIVHLTRPVRWSCVITLLCGRLGFAEVLGQGAPQCGTLSDALSAPLSNAIGGVHISAVGTFRILIVFASFPDDLTPHPYWPAHEPPVFMEQFVDPDTATRSQGAFNLTHYFHEMSLGQFDLVGDALWVETAHSQEEYRNGSYGRANTDVLRERVDSLVDFSRYDEWTRQSAYSHANVPDGQVDMIVMVWRTNMFEYLGEASLGYKPGFVVDGKRIELGFPENIPYPLGSGVTCEYVYTDGPSQAMQTMIHELSHWLLGGPHPYNGKTLQGKHAYWGMLCNGRRTGSCANAYDRERLGWAVVPEIQPDVNVVLPDYVQTGIAYKYHPPNGEPYEYFYIENHQGFSLFDDVTTNPEDRGLWILHQQGPYFEIDNLKIRPSDGSWQWENPGVSSSCFSQSLPVFRRGEPNTMTGESHRDQIPTSTSLVNWMFVYEDPLGERYCGAFFKGQMFSGAFHGNSNLVFSPYSNPNSSTWGNQVTTFSLEIVDDINGTLSVRYNSNLLDTSPARRYLGLDPTAESFPPGSLALAWGAQWTEGQPLEPDVNWSELQRQAGAGEAWSTVYEGPLTTWRDESVSYGVGGTVPVLFRARVRDTQGKYSSWSSLFRTAMFDVNAVGEQLEGGLANSVPFRLAQNYPNPANPSTSIEFTLAVPTTATLTMHNLLGEEVMTVLSGKWLGAGLHRFPVKADELPSGIYLYRLTTPGFSQTRKMLLVR